MVSTPRNRRALPLRRKADISFPIQAYNVPSPNEMVVDSDFIENDPEKDPVTIINPDNLDHDEQVSNLPLATDRTSALIPSPAVG